MVDKINVEQYTFVEVNESNGIKLDSGEFAGVIVRINSADVQEDGEDAVLTFDYDVIYDAEKTKEELSSIEFKNSIGNIIVSIIEQSVAEKNVEFEQIDIEESEF